jgi:DNA-binding transcriptional LysR family regulator
MRPNSILNKGRGVLPGRADLSLKLVIHGGGVALVPNELIAEELQDRTVADLVADRSVAIFFKDNGR